MDDPSIIAVAPSMRRAVELARCFAPTTLPILLVGETGTGKEVLAQAIHRWSGRSGPLVDVNCGALPASTVTNELFGHRRGSYTGATETVPGLVEAAHRGTLFLDELGSLTMDGQSALLRVVETGELCRVGDTTRLRVAIRLIGAVHDGQIAGAGGAVRHDLIHRLAGCVIPLASLRERVEDIWPLARHFAGALGRTVAAAGRPVLERHEWPGNVRELRHVVQRAAALGPAGLIPAGAILEAIELGGSKACQGRLAPDRATVAPEGREQLVALCRMHACEADRIAAALHRSRSAIYRRLQRFGIRLDSLRNSLPVAALSHEVARQGATGRDNATALG